MGAAWLALLIGTVACSGSAGGDSTSASGGGSSVTGTGGTQVGTHAGTTGGATGTGQTATGGTTAAGGTTATGGTTSCPFPTTFQWSSSGSLTEPKSGAGQDFVSLKDFTHVYYNNQHIVYATVFDTLATAWDGTKGIWSSVSFTFADWPDAASAPQTWMGNLKVGGAVAPTLLYFTPKNVWVLVTQWGIRYATSTDPTDPSKWTAMTNMLDNGPADQIDPTFICDDAKCYLFFAADNGHIYRSSMPIGSFPGTFNGYDDILQDTRANLFEAVQVYTVKGTGEYLMIVEAMGSGGRFFRAFRASDLGGTFTAIAGADTESKPFAGKANVTFTDSSFKPNDISHGDLIRSDPSEKQEVDPCHLQMLYQGYNPVANTPYEKLPYRPALLTKTN